MKRAIFAATPRYAKRAVPLILLSAVALLMAACSLSSQRSSDLPPSLLAPQQTAQSTASVAFSPIIGAPSKVASQLNGALSSTAKDKNIPVEATGKADYTVRGYLVASPDSKGTKVSYIWDITDKHGKRARRFSGEEIVPAKGHGNPWSAIDDGAVHKIAAKAVDELASWLPKSSGSATTVATTGTVRPTSGTTADSGVTRTASAARLPNTAAATAHPGKIVAVVPPVSGAPGDGDRALAAAMKRHLASQGITVSDSNTAGAYVVRGTVQLGAAEAGKQPIVIRWMVLDPSGKRLKNAVVQRNKIEEGSLDGAWGQIADLAAGEAAKEVRKILPRPTS